MSTSTRGIGATCAFSILLTAGCAPDFDSEAALAVDGTSIETLELLGSVSPIVIVTDAHGTPHVRADTLGDGYVGVCYAMARDRLFQMDLLRRTGQGRLAEIFGEAVAEQDMLFRVEGLALEAADRYASANLLTRYSLRSCADGVNRFVEQNPLPLEFDVLGYAPEPWTPADSFTVAGVLASGLDVLTWQTKLQRAAISALVDPDVAAGLLPDAPAAPSMFDAAGNLNPVAQFLVTTDHASPPAVVNPLPDPALSERLVLPPSWQGFGFHANRASNNFAVDGHLTANGEPIVANDPHLQLTTPSLIYLVGLDVAGLTDMEGITIPGLPIFLSARTRHVSWAVTFGLVDDVDLYVEVLQDTPTGQLALFEDTWEPVATRQETIEVFGGDPIELTVRTTRHGPILNDAIPALDGFGPIALKSTFMQSEWKLDGFFELPLVFDSWQLFRFAVLRQSIGLNFLFADKKGSHGHVAYQQTGLAPQREDPANAYFPVPGTGGFEWTRYAANNELASVYDPPSHVLVTANNRIVPDDYAPLGEPVYISAYVDAPWRAQRAISLLLEDAPLTPREVATIQLDTYSVPAPAIAADLITALQRTGLPASDPDAAASFAALSSFDGDIRADSRGAAIYEVMVALLTRDLALFTIGPDLYAPHSSGVFFAQQLLALEALLDDPRAPFFGATGPADAADARDLAVQAALAEADALLRASLGPDPSTWTWGHVHTLTYNHPLAGLDPVFDSDTFPSSGDVTTVNLGGWFSSIGLLALPPEDLAAVGGLQAPFAQDALATARVVWNLNNLNGSLGVLSTGASGDPTSPHYLDQAELWRAGEINRLPFTRAAVGF